MPLCVRCCKIQQWAVWAAVSDGCSSDGDVECTVERVGRTGCGLKSRDGCVNDGDVATVVGPCESNGRVVQSELAGWWMGWGGGRQVIDVSTNYDGSCHRIVLSSQLSAVRLSYSNSSTAVRVVCSAGRTTPPRAGAACLLRMWQLSSTLSSSLSTTLSISLSLTPRTATAYAAKFGRHSLYVHLSSAPPQAAISTTSTRYLSMSLLL